VTFSWTGPRLHLAPLLLVVGLAIWYLEATSHDRSRASRAQRWAFGGGLLTLLVALSWPVADLATRVSLLFVVAQRLLLVLVAAPLLLLGTPVALAARLTRPAAIDTVASRLSRPIPALVTTTVVLGATALPWSVAEASEGVGPRAVALVAVFGAGLVLWLPVIERVPGEHHLRPMAKGGYLVAQAVAPSFLSFAWILSLHPLYHSLHGQQAVLGVSALTDQQLSGYLAKLGTFGVLLSVAYVLFMRSDGARDDEPDALQWIDVERELERAARRERRTGSPHEVP
jgi:cytochrome c oxidase assembly factor CtaG